MGRRLRLACCSLIVLSLLVASIQAAAAAGAAEPAGLDVHWNTPASKGKCKAGKHGLKCSQCPKGYFSEDGTHCLRCAKSKTTHDCPNGCTSAADCTEQGCPVGTFKSSSSSECEPCPVGTFTAGGYPYPKKCERCPKGTTTPGRGSYSSDQCVPEVCPAGSFRSGLDCNPCKAGSYSVSGADACTLCPEGMTTMEAGSKSLEQCVCKAGYEPSSDPEGICVRCKEGAFKPHKGDQECEECPWPKTTEKSGSITSDACECPVGGGKGPTCDECPENTVLLEDGMCGCPPGTGGLNCEECKANYFSPGGRAGQPRPKCKPCGLHFHSPAGSISAEYCECDVGYGADPEDEHRCSPCSLGTFNPGTPQIQPAAYPYQAAEVNVQVASASQPAKGYIPKGSGAGGTDKKSVLHTPIAKPCQRCGAAHPGGAFTTLQTGSVSASSCVCLPGYGGSGCAACPAGTYSGGGAAAVCQSCGPAGGAGYTTDPDSAATSIAACVCLAGYGISDNGMCRLCPRNTYSEGGSKEECRPCPFGSTSPAGSMDLSECVSVAQECPVGQMAPADAVSKEQCSCYPGFGGGGSPDAPCTICPAGTYARGGDLEACKPCKFGFTSAVGSTSAKDCYSVDQCPAGTEVPASMQGASTTQECRCKAGYGSPTSSGSCRLCPPGTFSAGGTMEDCKPCPFGYTSKAGAESPDECVAAVQACPVGQIPVEDAVSQHSCACLPGYGGGKTPEDACSICPAGTWAPGGNTQACVPCKFGYTALAGSTAEAQCYPANACAAGTEAPQGKQIASVNECVCKAGFGVAPGSKDGTCSLCSAGTFSTGGSISQCDPCPFGYTSAVGSTSKDQCVLSPQACPIGQWAPDDAVSAEGCRCYPGFGGGEKAEDPCTICPAGYFSVGKSLDKCVPCGFGLTSPVGSTSQDACYPVKSCPAGTRVPESKFRSGDASSAQECKCKAGYGSTTGEGVCRLCPVGTFAIGGSMEDCRPCPFGTTSEAGSTDQSDCRPVSQKCPVGQVAPVGAVSEAECVCLPGYGGGASPRDPCKVCPAGTWAPGGSTQACISCGFGYSSPEGSSSEAACYTTNACPAGTEAHRSIDTPSALSDCVCKSGYGSATGTGICRLCPEGTWSPGGTMEDCKPCPFGFTSAEGSAAKEQCRKLPQACPIGQWAPQDAVSAEECRCYKGFGGGEKPSDMCSLCPAGTFSANQGTAKCIPCRFGFTSPEGAEDEGECYPVYVCPAGTDIPQNEAGSSSAECKCSPGHGSSTGAAPCRTCPVGTYAQGGTLDECKPCPFGYSSQPGAASLADCVPAARRCPPGQVAPPDAVSDAQCACLPGYGSGETANAACHLCPPGSWSPGGSIQPCIPCGFGYSGPEGAVSGDQCVPNNACPAGTDYRQGNSDMAFSTADCVCKPGFGSATGSGVCRRCSAGTYAEGGSMEDCKPCGFGLTSGDGATRKELCRPVAQACPIGQWAPPDAVSPEECRCYKGFGGGDKPTDACSICPAGSYSFNKGTEKCRLCPLGFSSPEGAQSEDQCYPVNVCPAGTGVDGGLPPLSLSSCKCRPGFGSSSGAAPCRLCPVGTFSPGGSMEDCRPCPFGMTSHPGTASVDGCVPVAQPCPVGQMAPPDAVSAAECRCLPGFGGGDTPTDACKICPQGYWSRGGNTQPCKPCGFGYTSPEGAASSEQCVAVNACPAGTVLRDRLVRLNGLLDCVCKPGYGSVTGTGPCRLCPAGTWSPGGSMEECLPCGFGFTSAEGSASEEECRPVSQMCPIGQWASQHAVSAEECRCYKGFGGGDTPKDACTLCPALTYSANIGTEKCRPCPHGFTSPEGSGDESDCYPAEMCPAGTALMRDGRGHLSKDCKCKSGYGSSTGAAPCRLCPVGSYSEGGSMEDCMPCPFGRTSRAGAEAERECIPESQACPIGQIAPPKAVSAEECGCLPGYGGGASPKDPCKVCPPGSWSPGGSTQPCIPCGFGFSGPEGAWSERQCTHVNACPAGTEYLDHPNTAAFSVKDCVCKPGYGSGTGSGVCRLCQRGSYSPGGSMEDCVPCPDGKTSKEGAWSWRECLWSSFVRTPPHGRDSDADDSLAIMNQGAGGSTSTKGTTQEGPSAKNPNNNTPNAPTTGGSAQEQIQPGRQAARDVWTPGSPNRQQTDPAPQQQRPQGQQRGRMHADRMFQPGGGSGGHRSSHSRMTPPQQPVAAAPAISATDIARNVVDYLDATQKQQQQSPPAAAAGTPAPTTTKDAPPQQKQDSAAQPKQQQQQQETPQQADKQPQVAAPGAQPQQQQASAGGQQPQQKQEGSNDKPQQQPQQQQQGAAPAASSASKTAAKPAASPATPAAGAAQQPSSKAAGSGASAAEQNKGSAAQPQQPAAVPAAAAAAAKQPLAAAGSNSAATATGSSPAPKDEKPTAAAAAAGQQQGSKGPKAQR